MQTIFSEDIYQNLRLSIVFSTDLWISNYSKKNHFASFPMTSEAQPKPTRKRKKAAKESSSDSDEVGGEAVDEYCQQRRHIVIARALAFIFTAMLMNSATAASSKQLDGATPLSV